MDGTVKVFGLTELEALAAKKRKHQWEALQDVLDVMHIPNVAQDQANEAAKAVAAAATEADRKAADLAAQAERQRSLAESARNRERALNDLAKVAKQMTGGDKK